MTEASVSVSVSAQSLPIQRAENLGKVLSRHLPKASNPAGRTLLSLPRPGGFPGAGCRLPWQPRGAAPLAPGPRDPRRGGSLLGAAALFRSQFCCSE